MAELLGISYREIMFAAVIPSILFYLGVLMAIHFEATRYGYLGVPREQIPKIADTLHWSKSLPVFLPIIVLLYYFLSGYTPGGSAFRAIIALAVLYLITDIKDAKNRIIVLFKGLEQSSKDMLSVVVLIASAQIILSMLTLTGIGVKFVQVIISIGQNNLMFAGFLAMIATMVLGMGLPTVAAYLLSAAVIAPALVRMGVPAIAAHFFVFFYAVFAGITPPICGTVYVAAALAKATGLNGLGGNASQRCRVYCSVYVSFISGAIIVRDSTGNYLGNGDKCNWRCRVSCRGDGILSD